MDDTATAFETIYQKWKAFHESAPAGLSSMSEAYLENQHVQAIVDLGMKVVPYILEKVSTDEESHFLIHLLERITHKRFTNEEIETAQAHFGVPLGNQGYARLWQKWWIREELRLAEAARSDWKEAMP